MPDPGPTAATAVRSVPVRVLVPLFVGVATVRWLVSREREIFHLSPDEPGQLAMARFVAGGTRWNMFDHSTWRPAYATLIAPIHWFTGDPTTVLRSALAVNALLGGLGAVLLCLLARRLTDLSPVWCGVTAAVVSLLPAVMFTTAWVWSESLVAVVYLGTVLALTSYAERPQLGTGVTAAILASVAFASHSRMLPLVAVVAATAAVHAWRRRTTPLEAVAVVTTAGAATWLVAAYSRALVDRVWDDPTTTNTVGGVLERLTRPHLVALSATGQVWYQLVATAGIAGLGVVVLVRAARGRAPDDVPSRAAATSVLAAALPLVALSMVFMADRWRADHLVYGRYNDAVMGPIVVVGVAALVRARADRRLAVTLGATMGVAAATALVLLGLRGDELGATAGLRPMVIGIQGFTGAVDSVPVLRITVLATLVAGLVLGVAALVRHRARPWALVGLVAVLLLIAGIRTKPAVDGALNTWTNARPVERIDRSVIRPGVAVRYKEVPDAERPAASWGDQRHRRMLYQFYLPHHRFYLDGDPEATTPYVFAPVRDPELLAAGAELIWEDPAVAIGLWREP